MADYTGAYTQTYDGREYTVVPAREENIDNFTCVFKASIEIRGDLAHNKDSISNRPEHWSKSSTSLTNPNWSADYTVSTTAKGTSMFEVQANCGGHRLPNEITDVEYPRFKKDKVITPVEFNNLIDILNQQIERRKASTKYTVVYGNNPPATITKRTENEKIASLKTLLNSIKKLQPKKSYFWPSYDRHPEQTIQYPQQTTAGTIVSDLDYGKASGFNTLHPLVSKSNMDIIIKAIRTDINDCICYGDCNGYSVCCCYGNCAFY